MVTFGIFFGILTFVYVIYYGVMIFMDLHHMDAQKGDKSEIIPVANGQSVDAAAAEEEDDAPVHVSEHDYLGEGTEEEPVLTADEIRKQDTEELYRRSMESRKNMQPVHATATYEYSASKEREELARFENEDLVDEISKSSSDEEEEA